MKPTKEQIEKLLAADEIVLNWTAKCDLCGHEYEAIHKWPSNKADCPNCGFEAYTNHSFLCCGGPDDMPV